MSNTSHLVSDEEYKPRKMALDLLICKTTEYECKAFAAVQSGDFSKARALGRIQDVFSDAFINLIQK